jgi:hemoglobin
MRHASFKVDRAAHDAWLRQMRAAVDSLDLHPDAEKLLWDYLVMAADSLINSPD